MSGGRRGPAPKPTQLRILDGGHPERINHDEPVPRPNLPELPAEVDDPRLREVWDKTVAELDGMGLATAADEDSLLCFCLAVVGLRRTAALLKRQDYNPVIPGLHGGPVSNPLKRDYRHDAAVIRAFAQEFGLTPSARSRITTGKSADADEDNPFAGTG